jgi:2-polyprenyl-6-methoxyphenol hydroxylase-like FAD-dependent oxidoreductase
VTPSQHDCPSPLWMHSLLLRRQVIHCVHHRRLSRMRAFACPASQHRSLCRYTSRGGSAPSGTAGRKRGRVILAGDAAHRFPPAGGFGMNTGIQVRSACTVDSR